jgi:hypothetical protein
MSGYYSKPHPPKHGRRAPISFVPGCYNLQRMAHIPENIQPGDNVAFLGVNTEDTPYVLMTVISVGKTHTTRPNNDTCLEIGAKLKMRLKRTAKVEISENIPKPPTTLPPLSQRIASAKLAFNRPWTADSKGPPS